MAAILVNQRRLAEALTAYDDIVERWPSFSAAHVGRGLVLDALGKSPEAEAAYRAAVAADPANTEHRARLQAHLERAREVTP